MFPAITLTYMYFIFWSGSQIDEYTSTEILRDLCERQQEEITDLDDALSSCVDDFKLCVLTTIKNKKKPSASDTGWSKSKCAVSIKLLYFAGRQSVEFETKTTLGCMLYRFAKHLTTVF